MDLGRPLSTVTPTLDADVLAVLARAEASFTGRQVARLVTTGSVSGVSRALDRLVETGLVSRETAGSAYLYRLNDDHLAAPHVKALARLRDELARRIRDLVAAWTIAPDAVVLFGSAARGDMHARSDIDLFVVHPIAETGDEWDDQVAELERRVTAWTGNDARVLQMSRDELDAAADDEPLVTDVAEEGQVLFGPPDFLRKLRTQQRTKA